MSDKEVANPFQEPQQQTELKGLSQDAGFEIPVESVPLPSRGKVYPIDSGFANEESVEIRCMSAREEDILSSRALIKNGTVITKLIQSCLLNKSVDPLDLVSGDRNSLLIALRTTGYGSDYTAKVTCPDCEEQFENEFSLNGLKIKELGAEPIQPNTNLFLFTLPRTQKEVHFKLLTGREEQEISVTESRRKKLGNQVETNITSKLLYSIVSLDGDTDRVKIASFVRNMPAMDSRALRKYISDIEPDIDMRQHATCTSCGEESEVTVPLGISFFWPDIS